MKGYKVGGLGKPGQQRCKVTVAHKNLRMLGDRFQTKPLRTTRRQQVVRSISSSRTNDGSDIVAREHIFQFPRSAFRRTRKVQIALQDRLEIKRLVSSATKTFAARFQHFTLYVRRRRNNSHLVARTERVRLDSRLVGSGNHIYIFVIPREARDLQSAAKCRSLASLGMTIRRK